jgi:hypothetical protein
MIGESSLASHPNGEISEWFDVINAISLTLATISGLPLLAITIGSIWRWQ